MSRSQSYSSSHSHGGRSRGNSISVTEAGFQNLRVSQAPSSHRSRGASPYQPPDSRDPRSAYRQEDLTLQYLQAGYNPDPVLSASPSLRPGDSSRLSPSLATLDPENLGYIDPTTAFNNPDMRYVPEFASPDEIVNSVFAEAATLSGPRQWEVRTGARVLTWLRQNLHLP